jgi:aminobenzoyl-glutamate transport protein
MALTTTASELPLSAPPRTGTARALDWLERVGNRFPDPVVLFLVALALTWLASSLLSNSEFGLIDPRTSQPLRVHDQLSLAALSAFLSGMVQAFVTFAPLGMVLVMVIGVGVAERSGLVGGSLRGVLAVASPRLLTPLVGIAAIFGHLLSDSAAVIILPMGGALFYVAGRHPLAGIVAGLAPNFGAMVANFVPYGLDAILAGFSESGARLVNSAHTVNPLNNYWLSVATAAAVVPVTWWLVERVVEPRLTDVAVDGDSVPTPSAHGVSTRERRALWATATVAIIFVAALAWAVLPAGSPFRAPDGSLTGPGSPLMQAMIPLLLILTLLPSIAYGVVAGTLRSHRDIVEGMATTMSTMGYYVVMVFFAALFTKAFADSNIGALLALKGADTLRALGFPAAVTILGIILLTAAVDVVVPSASAKYALLAPIIVPMLMNVGIAPDLTQAAFRVGDGPVNLLTPLMPHFPLVLIFCRRYVTGFGMGSLMALVLPFGITYLILQTTILLTWWGLGLPLGIGSTYTYP